MENIRRRGTHTGNSDNINDLLTQTIPSSTYVYLLISNTKCYQINKELTLSMSVQTLNALSLSLGIGKLSTKF